MTARTHHSAASPSPYRSRPDADDFAINEHGNWQLQPEDRIEPAPGRRRGAALAVAIAVLIALGCGMALLDDRVRPHLAPQSAAPADTAALAERIQPAAQLPLTTPTIPSEPARTVDPGPATAEETPSPTVMESNEPLEPLPPPSIDKTDPYQVRAMAVGLHPGLSHVLLAKLSADDYRNAGIAIRTALAETPFGESYIWPRQGGAEPARFRVHFVRGAAAPCRRYIVAIAKDGWATTAQAMENCESRPGKAKRE